jgi:hypothetical protein
MGIVCFHNNSIPYGQPLRSSTDPCQCSIRDSTGHPTDIPNFTQGPFFGGTMNPNGMCGTCAKNVALSRPRGHRAL